MCYTDEVTSVPGLLEFYVVYIYLPKYSFFLQLSVAILSRIANGQKELQIVPMFSSVY